MIGRGTVRFTRVNICESLNPALDFSHLKRYIQTFRCLGVWGLALLMVESSLSPALAEALQAKEVRGLYHGGAEEAHIYAASEIRNGLSSELLYPVCVAARHRLFVPHGSAPARQNHLGRCLRRLSLSDHSEI